MGFAGTKEIPYPGAKSDQADLLRDRLTALDAFRAGLARGETLDPATVKPRPGTARKPMQEKAMGDPMVTGRTQRVPRPPLTRASSISASDEKMNLPAFALSSRRGE